MLRASEKWATQPLRSKFTQASGQAELYPAPVFALARMPPIHGWLPQETVPGWKSPASRMSTHRGEQE
ncbi:hypothetical protein DQ238_19275 [Geodermatophilus sp. TF02-6]|nr:hypothetical protein DQ238_19275 [Geodermatophilus sp. TF02-6]